MGRDSQKGVTDLIRHVQIFALLARDLMLLLWISFRDMQLDVVGFLETDLHVDTFIFGFDLMDC